VTNLRELARGMSCKLRIPGICNGDPKTVVLCHIKRGWCGSMKPPDIVAVWGCHACHDVIDRRRFGPWTEQELDSMILRALCEQLAMYAKTGVVKW
jgi:uncharacterized CHY-type Zn-finger protein